VNVIDLTPYIKAAKESEPLKVCGKVIDITGILIKVTGMKVSLGESCKIYSENASPVDAEVVGFKDGKVLLMPIGDLRGIRAGDRVISLGKKAVIKAGPELIGRIIDDRGNPMDGKSPIKGIDYPLFSSSPNPLTKRRITEAIDLGIRALNGLLTCGKGQRVGIMAGAGVGKSVLIGMMAKYTNADINVIALIGERAREVRDFIEKDLGEEGLKRSVVVVSTSDQPSVAKVRGAFTATAIAEYFRQQGQDVLLIMDSLTRVSMAQREIGLAVGEPPTTKGYTPSVFALMPKLLEKVGMSESKGSITGFYTVLTEGDDLSDPIADTAMSILDGHIVLSRELAMENHYPAIDVLRSVSRVMPDIIDSKQKKYFDKFIRTLSTYKKMEDMIHLGVYKDGSNPKVDFAIKMFDSLTGYLRQGMNERINFSDSIQHLYHLFNEKKND
jgi:flagellum-specific ATP synthase